MIFHTALQAVCHVRRFEIKLTAAAYIIQRGVVAAALRNAIAADGVPEFAAAAAMPESSVFSKQFSVRIGSGEMGMTTLRELTR